MIHMTLCTVASHHACNVVMIEVILCVASLSLCYTATCYDISGCIGPAGTWEIASVRLPPFISKPNKHKSSGSSLCWFAAFMCLQHNGSKDMRKQILTCWWQSHYPNWFPLLYMYSWCQSSAVDAN